MTKLNKYQHSTDIQFHKSPKSAMSLHNLFLSIGKPDLIATHAHWVTAHRFYRTRATSAADASIILPGFEVRLADYANGSELRLGGKSNEYWRGTRMPRMASAPTPPQRRIAAAALALIRRLAPKATILSRFECESLVAPLEKVLLCRK